MREIVAATAKGKPMIALIELDASRGGLSLEEVNTQLLEADALYDKWGFNLAGENSLNGAALYAHLFAQDPIEWNRIGHFQDVTMRLIARRLLPENAGATYVDRELISQTLKPLPPPSNCFHVYCSAINPGAIELLVEVGRERGFAVVRAKGQGLQATANTLHVTTDKAELVACDRMLLYLTSQTWTRGEASEALGAEIAEAMDLKVDVLLAHEMPGIGGQEARFGTEFGTFFCCPDGPTPPELLGRGIYSTIAVPLKGGAWREASMALMGLGLGMTKEEMVIAKEGGGNGMLRLAEGLESSMAGLSKSRMAKMLVGSSKQVVSMASARYPGMMSDKGSKSSPTGLIAHPMRFERQSTVGGRSSLNVLGARASVRTGAGVQTEGSQSVLRRTPFRKTPIIETVPSAEMAVSSTVMSTSASSDQAVAASTSEAASIGEAGGLSTEQIELGQIVPTHI